LAATLEKVAEEIDEEVRRIIDHAHELARTLIRDNRAKLDHLARTLLEIETLEGDQLLALMAASTYTKLGCVAEQEGDLPAAGQWHARALGTLADVTAEFMPSNPTLAVVVEGIAALSAARGEPIRAAELLGLAHTLQGFGNAASLEVKRAKAAIATDLDSDAYRAAYARGRELSRDDALALTP